MKLHSTVLKVLLLSLLTPALASAQGPADEGLAKGSKALLFGFGVDAPKDYQEGNAVKGGAGLEWFVKDRQALRFQLSLAGYKENDPADQAERLACASCAYVDGYEKARTLGVSVAYLRYLTVTRSGRLAPYWGAGGLIEKANIRSLAPDVARATSYSTVERSVSEDFTTWGAQAVMGVKYFVTRDLSVSAEYRLGRYSSSASQTISQSAETSRSAQGNQVTVTPASVISSDSAGTSNYGLASSAIWLVGFHF